ncbi:type 4 pilus major pilin [Asaia bogorensis]|uniref:Type 4 secretion system PilS N-terminal domain-containing protein n=1 Tax=Asaia bogorensis NBRC 16594 TaxID=1231624 RepID=A0AAN4R842_9PROT|nr:type 4 pilus major pilin [Asaia bogorensis]GBQ81509.1 hypothetical protein AA0311_2635 [Asaia bogorensis NBRC 16594]GEL54844.1 hypothetical protein ABO01nite_28510 [Asaia bogorensis NBRC 16594]
MGNSNMLSWILTGVVSLLAIVAVGVAYYTVTATDNLSDASHEVSVIAADVRQYYVGVGATDFSDLSNQVAIKAGAGEFAQTGTSNIRLPWPNSTLTLSGTTDTFLETATYVPASSCAPFARGKKTISVTVNGQQLAPTDTAGIAQACGTTDENTVAFEFSR